MKILWCWRCQMEVPMLDEEEYAIACKLYSEEMQNGRTAKRLPDFQSLLNYYNALTGFNETVHNAIMHHRIAEQGPLCESCGKPYRTPLASLCAACGNPRDLSQFKLKEMFYVLLGRYPAHYKEAAFLWKEIETSYSGPGRHYHTLAHLEYMLSELVAVKDQINDWDAVLFALYYHDVIYKALKSDNEDTSASLAIKRMRGLHVAPERINRCQVMILATKRHSLYADQDVNYLTDADLSILGHDWGIYAEYMGNVRKEYHRVPGFLYRMNRKNVLRHFLAMEQIFKTEHFYRKYEEQARKNIQQELKEL